MVSFRSLVTAAVGAASIFQNVVAHSAQRNPLSYVSLLEEPTISNPSKRVTYNSHFDLFFYLHDQKQQVRLALEPNHDIIHESSSINFLGQDGKIRHTEKIQRHEHKVFRGNAFIRREGRTEWTNVGWARVTVHRDGKRPILDGAFRMNGDNHHIQTGSTYLRLKHAEDPVVTTDKEPDEYMVVWRDSDIQDYWHDPQDLKRDVQGRVACDTDSLEFNANYDPTDFKDPLPGITPKSLFGRQIDPGQTGDGGGAGYNLASTIGNPAGCPNTRKIALVGIATDCTYTEEFNSTQSVRQNIISQVSAASQVYESSFNISLGIQNLTISDSGCPATPNDAAPWNQDCDADINISDRLNLFSAWRGQTEDTNAFWTLLSTCGTGSAVGLAWLGQVCVQGAEQTSARDGSNETVSSANVVIRTQSEWQVFAHEAGHTFGAVHDCDETACRGDDMRMQRCCPLSGDSCDADGQFIMNPSTGRDISDFSPCTIGNICSSIRRNSVNSDCLTENRNIETIAEAQCGNGIVESGEDCDCGDEEACGDNSCCDMETCRFTDNSVCDPSNEDCCTDQCQFASSGSVCRESTGECDPEETCPGDSSVCPRDDHEDDGTSCGDDGDGLQCASGQCTSRDQQCQSALGSRDSGNNTSACDNGCMLSCRAPSVFETDQCRLMNQNFLDGTPCESGGRCDNGVCQGASSFNDARDWFEENKHIVIPVAASVGGLIVLAIVWCCIASCCRKRKVKKMAKQAPTPSPPPVGGGWGRQDSGFQQRPPMSHYGDSHYNQSPPQYQPYSYQTGGGQAYPGQWQPSLGRQTSMRYA